MAHDFDDFVYNETDQTVEYKKTSKAKENSFVTKTFLYLALGLFLTALTSATIGFLFTKYFPLTDANNANVYLALLIGSAILTFILSIVLNFTVLRSKTNAKFVPYILYTVSMGALLSSFTMFIEEWYVIPAALIITLFIYIAMALIGYNSKSGKVLFTILTGLGLGLLTLTVGWLIIYFFAHSFFNTLYIAISLISFLYMMIVTAVDMRQVKQYQEQGLGNNNFALFMAYRLYVDFVYIFIRILRIILILTSKRN